MLMVEARTLKRTKTADIQSGFTIVELMVAMLVFSVIMLLAAGTVVRFTNNFQRGVTQTNTQAVARGLIDNISQTIQFGGTKFQTLTQNPSSGTMGYCVGVTSYSYDLYKQLDSSPTARHALVEDPSGCNSTTAQDLSGSPVGQELLSPGMRLTRFSIDKVQGTDDLFRLEIRVVYGDDDLLCRASEPAGCTSSGTLPNLRHADLRCKDQIGSQYCAVSELSTTVQRRL